jgi:hypothetical protein
MQAPSFDKGLWEELSDSERLGDYARYEGSIFDQTRFPGGKHYKLVAYMERPNRGSFDFPPKLKDACHPNDKDQSFGTPVWGPVRSG